jgi:7,8-dihydroneopterin aldolase/epimerase/oxygenase
MDLFSIHLKNLRFIAFHGVHEEETLLGNEFEVNVTVQFEVAGKVAQLEDTINYAAVFAITKQRMAMPTGLLETVAEEIGEKIAAMDRRITATSVSIDKLNTPVEGLNGRAGVTYTTGGKG